MSLLADGRGGGSRHDHRSAVRRGTRRMRSTVRRFAAAPKHLDGSTGLGCFRHEGGNAVAAMIALARAAAATARRPGKSVRSAADLAGSMFRAMRPQGPPLSTLMTGRWLSVRYDTLTVDFNQIRAAGKAAGARFNDIFVAAVVGGIADYQRRHNVDDTSLRMFVPVNVREDRSSRRRQRVRGCAH